jgi:hypothetical protein
MSKKSLLEELTSKFGIGFANDTFRIFMAKILNETGAGRQKLTENTTFYLSTTGNDTTGDGTEANPWATLQYAYEWVAGNVDGGGYDITFLLGPGTYVGLYLLAGKSIPGTRLTITSTTGDMNDVLIGPSTGFSTPSLYFDLVEPMVISVYDVTISNTSGTKNSYGIGVGGFAKVLLGCDLGYTSHTIVSIWLFPHLPAHLPFFMAQLLLHQREVGTML